jgi:hypothetical protein
VLTICVANFVAALVRHIYTMQYMSATLLERSKETLPNGVVVEVVIWAVTPPIAGSVHGYKYRLYAGRRGATLVRYDNEAGKGDHKHLGAAEVEVPFVFVSMAQTVRDFLVEVTALTGD